MHELSNLVPSTTHQSASLNVIEYKVLHDGEAFYAVNKDFYDSVLLQVEEVIKVLTPGKKYNLKTLCGEEFWDLLDNGERRMAGRCMADIVCRGLLPLTFARSKHEYPKHYQLK